jgi:pilus assembly protein CpaE
MIGIAEQEQGSLFFIFVSHEISANDYKQLIRSGSADWASWAGAPQEIADIILLRMPAAPEITGGPRSRLAIATFVPSSGGVGNATLALETAVALKLEKQTRNLRICLFDLDFQSSHLCDYLDIDARLQLHEIVGRPERLDAQLFDLFISSHSTGLAVLASPRSRKSRLDLDVRALDSLFGMIATRYDLLIIDLPPLWFPWTEQVLAISDLAVVTGLNTVPGLRQVAETLRGIRESAQVPPQIVIGLNRCRSRLLGRVANRLHAQKILGSDEKIFYVREDSLTTEQAVNTGIPAAIGAGSSRLSRDTKAIAKLMTELKSPAPPSS